MLRVNVCQINLQKAREATQLFQAKLQQHTFIGCVTEPYSVANKIVFRPVGYQVIPGATLQQVPRAALYLPSHIRSVELSHLSSADWAVAQIKWNEQEVVLVSGYMDIEEPVVSDELTNIMSYVVSHNAKLVLAVDSNSHSSFYSLAQSNERGRRFEDFILQYMLQVENRGNISTFQSTRAQSVIDVTLTKNFSVWDWHVNTDYNASDHNTIYFKLEADLAPAREVRPWQKADWRIFTDSLDKQRVLPERMTCKKLDREVDRMYDDLNIALDAACPVYTVSHKRKKADWYTEEIASLHVRVRKQFKKAMDTGVEEEKEKYEILRKKFRRRCRRSKTRSWRKFVDETPDQNKMAVLSRIALHKDRQSLSVLNNGMGGSLNQVNKPYLC